MAGAAFGTSGVVAVAYSGGRDSSALLHATRAAAEPLGIAVLALHVHHGLSRFADAWARHCRAECERAGVAFALERLAGPVPPGDSVEAWARAGRYLALQRMATRGGATLLLLAQHRRDQAETVLLQALRGAGVAGLSGMPREAMRDGVRWARPWLGVAREHIDAYIEQHAIQFIEDDSNVDPRFARNRLRLRVWPALTAAFAQAESTLATAAGWAQEAAACLDELARIDLAQLDAASAAGGMAGAPIETLALPLREWQRLSLPRRSNVLRAWLRRATGQGTPAALVARLLHELPGAGSATWTCASGHLHRHRGRLSHVLARAASPLAEPSLRIARAGRYRLPGWCGAVVAERVKEGGVPLAWLAHVELRPRAGGERFQAGLGRPPRSLKKQFQAAGLAAWERDAPLFFSGGQLVFVPGLGLDARVIGLPGQPQMRLHWQPV